MLHHLRKDKYVAEELTAKQGQRQVMTMISSMAKVHTSRASLHFFNHGTIHPLPCITVREPLTDVLPGDILGSCDSWYHEFDICRQVLRLSKLLVHLNIRSCPHKIQTPGTEQRERGEAK